MILVKINKAFIFLSLLLVLATYTLLLPGTAQAVCPICTVAVGAGLGLSRWLGIDDAVSSIWIGGLILSTSFWTIDWIRRKKFKFIKGYWLEFLDIIVIFSVYALVLIPLWLGKIIGDPLNTIIGIDKIVFGTALGSGAFLLGMWVDKKIRNIKGKQLFVYQKVVFPVISLVLTSLLIYYYGGYLY